MEVCYQVIPGEMEVLHATEEFAEAVFVETGMCEAGFYSHSLAVTHCCQLSKGFVVENQVVADSFVGDGDAAGVDDAGCIVNACMVV